MSLLRPNTRTMSLFDPFENFFDRAWSLPALDKEGKKLLMPATDITESKDAYLVTAELPGIDKDDIKVFFENGTLCIEAETESEDKQEEKGVVVRQERRYGKYVRRFGLGADVSDDRVEAHFKEGVLSLRIPKAEPSRGESRVIKIS